MEERGSDDETQKQRRVHDLRGGGDVRNPPQTLRLYEREGLLKPRAAKATPVSTRKRISSGLEFILSLARDLGVNIAGIGIILNMRERIEQMQEQMQDFVQYVQQEVMLRPRPAPGRMHALVPVRRSTPVVIPPAPTANSSRRR